MNGCRFCTTSSLLFQDDRVVRLLIPERLDLIKKLSEAADCLLRCVTNHSDTKLTRVSREWGLQTIHDLLFKNAARIFFKAFRL